MSWTSEEAAEFAELCQFQAALGDAAREEKTMAEKSDPLWIEHANLKEGALRDKTATKEGKDISAKRLHAAEGAKNATTRKQAHLAEELSHFKHG